MSNPFYESFWEFTTRWENENHPMVNGGKAGACLSPTWLETAKVHFSRQGLFKTLWCLRIRLPEMIWVTAYATPYWTWFDSQLTSQRLWVNDLIRSLLVRVACQPKCFLLSQAEERSDSPDSPPWVPEDPDSEVEVRNQQAALVAAVVYLWRSLDRSACDFASNIMIWQQILSQLSYIISLCHVTTISYVSSNETDVVL